MNLINLLKTDPDARKIFGKRELKIIEKQLLGINLTQSEKNRLSRDIRKKFEFIEKAGKYNDQFKLKKRSLTQERIDYAIKTILSGYAPKIKRIILFGSVAENNQTFRSDVDIAVEFKKIDLKEATIFRRYISGRVHDKVDVQVLEFLPEKIKKDIKRKGKVLYTNEAV